MDVYFSVKSTVNTHILKSKQKSASNNAFFSIYSNHAHGLVDRTVEQISQQI